MMAEQRDYILIYLNGQRRELRGAQVFMTLSDYLRYERQLTGTKVVCAEGDCGACSVMVGAVKPNALEAEVQYQVINACIQFMHGLDCAHIITIEGLPAEPNQLHPVQAAMVEAQATQCGFCTPGFVMAAACMLEQEGTENNINPQKAKNYLTGNLCRCTGYLSIINAMTHINATDEPSIKQRYHLPTVHEDLLQHGAKSVVINHEGHCFISPATAKEAANVMSTKNCRVFAAATDLGVQHNKGHWQTQRVVSLNLIGDLHQIQHQAESVLVGARVSLAALEQALKCDQPEWADFMHIFASPQIKNNATLVGNVANGSPIGDNLPFLLALDAKLIIQGPNQQRSLNINDFYTGYKQFNLAEGELITHIEIPHKPKGSVLKLYKVSQRRDLDISCVSSAIMLTFDQQKVVQRAAIALGGVAATALRIKAIEQQLIGHHLTEITDTAACQQVAQKLAAAIKPMSDVRGSDVFRKQLVANLYRKYIDELTANEVAVEASHVI